MDLRRRMASNPTLLAGKRGHDGTCQEALAIAAPRRRITAMSGMC